MAVLERAARTEGFQAIGVDFPELSEGSQSRALNKQYSVLRISVNGTCSKKNTINRCHANLVLC